MWTRAAVAVGLALVAGGCTTSPSATTGAAELKTNNVTGTVSTTLPVGLDAAFRAAQGAVSDLKFTMTKSAADALKGVVEARTADGTSVETTVTKIGDALTKLEVSAGPTRTEVARAVVAKIQERVK
jgi:hypothetical protein